MLLLPSWRLCGIRTNSSRKPRKNAGRACGMGEKLEEGAKELNGYQKQIAKVREMVQGLLQSMDAKSEEVEMQIQTVKAACPRHNMTLFERNQTEEA